MRLIPVGFGLGFILHIPTVKTTTIWTRENCQDCDYMNKGELSILRPYEQGRTVKTANIWTRENCQDCDHMNKGELSILRPYELGQTQDVKMSFRPYFRVEKNIYLKNELTIYDMHRWCFTLTRTILVILVLFRYI